MDVCRFRRGYRDVALEFEEQGHGLGCRNRAVVRSTVRGGMLGKHTSRHRCHDGIGTYDENGSHDEGGGQGEDGSYDESSVVDPSEPSSEVRRPMGCRDH
jgi:hypothetical protein